MPTLWTISLLGGLTAKRAGQKLIRFQIRKTSSLLANLAFHLNEDVNKETLIELFWPEADISHARHSLSDSLSTIRRCLEPPGVETGLVIQADHSCVRLSGAATTTDLQRLNLTIAGLKQCDETAEKLALMRTAASLYTGELLPGFFDDWILMERSHLSEAYLQMSRGMISILKRTGQLDEALEYALRSIPITNDHEELHAEVLKIMIDMGRVEDAIGHFEEYRERLSRTCGRAPGRDLWHVMEPCREKLLPVIPTRKRAVRRKRAMPNVVLAAPARFDEQDEAACLPTPLTEFFGRRLEIANISTILTAVSNQQDDPQASRPARLVTVTGLGGCGKTRFAIEAGRQIEKQGAFGNRIAFVPLSGISRADEIPQAIADVLQLATSGGSQSVASQVMSELGRKRWLLILDNCEHLPEAHETVQKLIEYLPDLRILATSRMPLEVVGEHLFGLLPLAAPQNVTTPTALYEFPSVQMFVNRAQAVSHDFQITERNAETLCMIMQRKRAFTRSVGNVRQRAAADIRRSKLGDGAKRRKGDGWWWAEVGAQPTIE